MANPSDSALNRIADALEKLVKYQEKKEGATTSKRKPAKRSAAKKR